MSRKRRLSPEEEQLWKRVVAKDKPLPDRDKFSSNDDFARLFKEEGSPRNYKMSAPKPSQPVKPDTKGHPASDQQADAAGALNKKIQQLPVSFGRGGKRGVAGRSDVEPQSGDRPISFQRQEVRRLRSGAYALDDRIDLHGLRQVAARRKLLSFVTRCQRDGMRFVLVITGKGGNRDGRQELPPDPMRLPWEEGLSESGILRTQVPVWLSEVDFLPLVVRWSEAQPSHGGGGALYVHIRRRY